jgi:hypothetical protein
MCVLLELHAFHLQLVATHCAVSDGASEVACGPRVVCTDHVIRRSPARHAPSTQPVQGALKMSGRPQKLYVSFRHCELCLDAPVQIVASLRPGRELPASVLQGVRCILVWRPGPPFVTPTHAFKTCVRFYGVVAHVDIVRACVLLLRQRISVS